MNFSRRFFIYAGSQWLVGCRWGAPVLSRGRTGVLLSPYRTVDKDRVVSPGLAFFDIDQRIFSKIELDFFPHDLFLKDGFAFLTSFRSSQFAKLDLKHKKVSLIKNYSEENISLYGHVAMRPNKPYIYATGYSSNFQGLYLIDSISLRIVDKISLGRSNIHQCKFIDDHHLLVTGKGNITKIHLPSGEKETLFQESPDHLFAHIEIFDDKSFFCTRYKYDKKIQKIMGTPSYEFEIVKGELGKNRPLQLKRPENSDLHKDQILSLRISPNKKFLLSVSPWQNKIALWDATSLKLIAQYNSIFPTGVDISIDGSSFVVQSNEGVYLFSTEDGHLIKGPLFQNEVKSILGDNIKPEPITPRVVSKRFVHTLIT